MFTLRNLRAFAIIFALSVMCAEAWRSWGEMRPLAFVWDDTIVGLLMIFSALMLKKHTTRRRAFFSCAWGVNTGMLYGSFFEKLAEPEAIVAGNVNPNTLTFLIGLAFVISCFGTIASIMLSRDRYHES